MSGQQLNVTFSPCFSSVTCQVESFGTCNVTFRNNFTDNIQVSGQVNDEISLSNLQVNVRYKYSALYNSTFFMRGNVTIKCKYISRDFCYRLTIVYNMCVCKNNCNYILLDVNFIF